MGALHLLHGLKQIQPNTQLWLTSSNKRKLTEESIIEDVLQWMPDVTESIDCLQKIVCDPLVNNLEERIVQPTAPTTKNSGETYDTLKGLMLSLFIIGIISFFDFGGIMIIMINIFLCIVLFMSNIWVGLI